MQVPLLAFPVLSGDHHGACPLLFTGGLPHRWQRDRARRSSDVHHRMNVRALLRPGLPWWAVKGLRLQTAADPHRTRHCQGCDC